MANHSSPLMAKPTTARIAHTTNRITITVNMRVTVLAHRAASSDRHEPRERESSVQPLVLT
jgi:hypothetical protein